MRLINVDTLEIKQFYNNIPQYAILSHTWGEEEVTYQEWVSWLTSKDQELTHRNGFEKIMGACRQTAKDELQWMWVDTNCIDKTNPTELSEAINSMYAWYRDSEMCYAFLSDVGVDGNPVAESSKTQSFQPDSMAELRRSRWFTRGWTLQELLAPKEVVFYSRNWMRLGCKTGGGGAASDSLLNTLSSITSIPRDFLSGDRRVNNASSAMKMSWLSKRETTRIEDIAYCALGIFDINMPLLYGEGPKAFIRLQEEIIRSRHDHTIFCWHWNEDVPSTWTSILAPSPRAFQESARYTIVDTDDVTPYSITNVGLSISLPVVYALMGAIAVLSARDITLCPLTGRHYRACIHLRQRHLVSRNHFERVMHTRTQEPLLRELLGVPWRPTVDHSLFVTVAQTQSSTGFFSPNPKFAILLSFHPDSRRFFTREGTEDNPEFTSFRNREDDYCVETIPDGCFFEERNIIEIPPVEHSEEPFLAVLLYFFKDAIDILSYRRCPKYCLFFMVDASQPEASWHYRIWSEGDAELGTCWRNKRDFFKMCKERGRKELKKRVQLGERRRRKPRRIECLRTQNLRLLLLPPGPHSFASHADGIEVREAHICPKSYRFPDEESHWYEEEEEEEEEEDSDEAKEDSMARY